MVKTQLLVARRDPITYSRTWAISCSEACTKNSRFCCYAWWCGYCASYSLRKRALRGDMSRYICCNGLCPCSGHCCEQSCPRCCLCCEVCCCFTMSVYATRFLIQDEQRILTDQCDNCIISTMLCLDTLSLICSVVGMASGDEGASDLGGLFACISDMIWLSVCACMQAQHDIELRIRDATPGGGVQMVPPPVQVITTGYGAPPVQVITTTTTGYAAPPPGGYYAANGQYVPPQQAGPMMAGPPGPYPPPQGYPGYAPGPYPPGHYPPGPEVAQGYPAAPMQPLPAGPVNTRARY